MGNDPSPALPGKWVSVSVETGFFTEVHMW
jgi:hypothetical protein